MEKNTIIKTFLFLLMFLNKTEAQKPKIILSFEGAPNLRFLSGNFNQDQIDKPAVGFYTGLTAQIPVSQAFSFVTGVGFERKGSVIKTDWTDFNGGIRGIYSTYINYDYWVIPALIRANFGEKLRYYLNFGLNFGHLSAAKINVERPDFPNAQFEDKRIKKIDFGVSFGGGMRLNITKNLSVPIEIRSNHGLLNINESVSFNNGKIRTNTIDLIIGLSYHFANN
jgi:opacity protein-like surface antigen